VSDETKTVAASAASDARTTAAADEHDEWWNEPDISLEPPPAQARALRRELPISDVGWADDAQHPDYHHLDASFPDQEFELTAADLELIIRANRFEPTRDQQRILFGLRGAELVGGSKASGPGLRIRLARPNHRDFRCVVGVYNTDTNTLSGFIGSTVPWHTYVHDFYQRGGSEPRTNMLPTGCYPYFVGPHGAHQIPGCFRLGTGFGDNQQERVAVLRTLNDVTYNTQDVFDLSIPHDNLHPSFGSGIFQSRGCQTVRGSYSGRHTGEWAEFRQAVGLQERGDNGRRFDYILITGLEAAIASKLRRNAPTPSPNDVLERLTRLRHGSRGEVVRVLQQKLGLDPTGLFGAKETKALAELQRMRFERADGVYSPETDKRLGHGLFGAAPVVVASRERHISPGASRIALVVGVGAYANAPSLSNPKNDAAAIAERLTKLGFGVTFLADETQNTLLQAIDQFNDALARAEVGFVFFAGHGVQIEGENYLLPRDTQVDGEIKLKGTAVPLDFILDGITRSQKTGIVFLDCCRDNPFGGKAGSRSLRSDYRGLAKIDAPRGTFIAFSTSPGLTASDGVEGERNSPFTSAVLRHIETVDLRISDLMMTVRREVNTATGGHQIPWENSSLMFPFSFNQQKEDLGSAEDQRKADREAERNREEAHWTLAEQTKSPELLESFVTLYPYSRHRGVADSTLKSIRTRRLVKTVGLAACGLILAVVGVGAYVASEYEKATRHTYQKIQSEFLARESLRQTVKENDPGTGLLLALEASRDEKSDIPLQKDRPSVDATAASLEVALRALREVKTLTGHDATIYSVAVTPDGRLAVTGSSDRTARVWDLRTGKEKQPQLSHTAPVYSVAVTQDGTRVVTGAEKEARVWDANTGKLLRTLPHKDFVNGIALTPDGKRAVTTSSDRLAQVWDLSTGEKEAEFKDHTSAVYGVAITRDGMHVVTGSSDRTARIWDISKPNDGSVLWRQDAHKETVFAVAFSPDGSRVVTGSIDRTARIWDSKTGKMLRVLEGHTGPVYSVAVTPDGTRVATGSADDTIRVWNLETGAELAVIKGHQGDVRAVAATPDGLVSVASDRTLRIWDLEKRGAFALRAHDGAVRSVAFLPGRRLVTASEDRSVRIWDWKTGDKLNELKGHIDSVTSVAITSDGTRIVTGSADGTARVWDAKTGTQLAVSGRTGHRSDVNSVVVSIDGKWAVTGSSDKTAKLWYLPTGNELLTFKGHDGPIRSVALTPDGSRVVTASGDKTARVWNSTTGMELAAFYAGTITSIVVTPDGKRAVTGATDRTARVWDIETGAEHHKLSNHKRLIYGVALTPDGRRAVTASWDGTARVWDISTGKVRAELKGHKSSVNSAAVTVDGKWVVTGSNDRTARIWDIDTGVELRILDGHKDSVYSTAVTADGRRVITGSRDRTARVWDFHTGKMIHELKAHQGVVHSVAVTPDGKRVITGSWDNTARLWDIETGDQIAVLGGDGHSGKITGVAIAPDGSRFVTTSVDETARVWDMKTGNPLFVFEKHTSEVNGVAITPDGNRAVTVSGSSRSRDNTVRVWDLKTGEQLYELEGHRQKVTSVALLPGGKRVITSSYDGTVRVWDIDTPDTDDKPWVLDVGGQVTAVSVMPDGERVVVGSWDKTMQVWDLKTRRRLFAVESHQGPVTSIAVLPDGSRIATGSSDKSAIVWNAEALPTGQKLIDEAKGKATRCLSEAQRSDVNLIDLKTPSWCGEMWPHDKASVVVDLVEKAFKHLNKQEYLAAVAPLEKATALNPSPDLTRRLALTHNSVAWDHFLNGRYSEGLPHAEKAVALASDNAAILDTRGQIYLGLDKVELAFADLDNAIEKMKSTSPGTLFGRGVCYERKGNKDEAAADYRRALQQAARNDYDRSVHTKAQERLVALTGEKGPWSKKTP
jgi:WD40 repeat protein